MSKTFIFGHKKPDTDSVCAAISLSYLKNTLGLDTKPVVLGDINNETKFVLNYFKQPIPEYLNDVKLQIRDLDYLKDAYVLKNKSLFETYKYMNENKISNVPIIDNNKQFLGITSMKDIASALISDDSEHLCTSYDNIKKNLNGKEILKFDEEIQGEILVASYKSQTFIENLNLNEGTIVIVGNRDNIIEYAIQNKVKLLVLTASSNIKDEHIKLAKKNKVNIIKTDYFSFKVARLIGLSNYVFTIINKENVITFNELEDVFDFLEIANKTRYSNFPVINKKNECLGLVKLADVASKHRKKVILVDHNEMEQSIDGLDEAEILEIVDHHKIGSLATTMPINFRNMPVGSTNTIIYTMYKENHIDIPKNMAGLMLSGIISDTLLFKSPTTTKQDELAGYDLAKIANVDISKYAMKMFQAASIFKGKNHEEILYTDFKTFTINNKKIGVSQISTVNIEDFDKEIDSYIDLIEKIAKNNDYYILLLLVTDILNNGSYIYYNKIAEDVLNNCFNIKDLHQGYYLEGVISRKKQVIPKIMDVLDKK